VKLQLAGDPPPSGFWRTSISRPSRLLFPLVQMPHQVSWDARS